MDPAQRLEAMVAVQDRRLAQEKWDKEHPSRVPTLQELAWRKLPSHVRSSLPGSARYSALASLQPWNTIRPPPVDVTGALSVFGAGFPLGPKANDRVTENSSGYRTASWDQTGNTQRHWDW